MKLLMEKWDKFLFESELEDAANTLQAAFKFNQELKKNLAKAPEQPDEREKELFKKIVDPAIKHLDKVVDESDNINTSEELRVWRKKFRPAIKGITISLKNVYKAAREQGFTISKPYLEMIIGKTEQELQHARDKLKRIQGYRGEDAEHQSAMDRIGKNNPFGALATRDPVAAGRKLAAWVKAEKWLNRKIDDGFMNASKRNDIKAMKRFKDHFSNFSKLTAAARKSTGREIEEKWGEVVKLAKDWGYGSE